MERKLRAKLPPPLSVTEGARGRCSALLARRRAERVHFLESLRDPDVIKDSENDEHFRTLVALAINDYRVNRRSLAALLGVSDAAVSRWANGKNAPPTYGRPQIIAMIGFLLEAALEAERKGEAEPEEVAPMLKMAERARR